MAEKGFRIKELWVFTSTDENDVEGTIGFMDPKKKQWIPMVCADKARLMSLLPIAREIAIASNRTITIKRYSTCSVYGLIEPLNKRSDD